MDLGTFSISLAVKDLKASREFYEEFGFEVIDGKVEENWLMLRNGTTKIGLFHGMFDHNTLTFNPADVSKIQREVKAKGITFMQAADEKTEGPAHVFLLDPDGNPILLDQF